VVEWDKAMTRQMTRQPITPSHNMIALSASYLITRTTGHVINLACEALSVAYQSIACETMPTQVAVFLLSSKLWEQAASFGT